jgi:hypothetical protein
MEFSNPFTMAVWFKTNIEAGKEGRPASKISGLGVCICVDYMSANDNRHYQTGFVYFLVEKARDGLWSGFDLEAKVIPQDSLWLLVHPRGSHAT